MIKAVFARNFSLALCFVPQHLAPLLVLVKASLGKNLGQLGVELFPFFHIFCCSNLVLGFLCFLQHKVTPVNKKKKI